MSTSQNGWPVLDYGDDRLHKWLLPGTSRHLILRQGSGGFLIAHYALWFHEKVERLDVGTWDDWGWAYRPIAGQTTGFSNHASGTAADLNAVHHPLGVPTKATFTDAQIASIHRVLTSRYDGALRWGGDYIHRPDAMHVEVNVPPFHAAEKVARKLMDTDRGTRLLLANPGQKAVILS